MAPDLKQSHQEQFTQVKQKALSAMLQDLNLNIDQDTFLKISSLISEQTDYQPPQNTEFVIKELMSYVDRVIMPHLSQWESNGELALEESTKVLLAIYNISGVLKNSDYYERVMKIFHQAEAILVDSLSKENISQYIDSKIDGIASLKHDRLKERQDIFHGIIKRYVAEGIVQKEEVNGEIRYFIMNENQRWNIELSGEYKVVIIADENPDIFYNIYLKDLFTGDLYLKQVLDNIRHFKRNIVQVAEENYKREQESQDILKGFDLPKDQEIYHLRIFPNANIYDDVIARSLQFSSLLIGVLRKNYPQLTYAPPLFSSSRRVDADLKYAIQKEYERGCRYFSLDIYSHGDKTGFVSFDTIHGPELSAQSLIELAEKFPDAHFTINTIACYGANLRPDLLKAFEDKPELAKQFSVFLQTKPYIVNLGGTQQSGEIYATDYYLFFAQALLQGKTYGEAAAEADQRVKKTLKLNPESIIDGTFIGHNENPSQSQLPA